jgi:hypothetical protein
MQIQLIYLNLTREKFHVINYNNLLELLSDYRNHPKDLLQFKNSYTNNFKKLIN